MALMVVWLPGATGHAGADLLVISGTSVVTYTTTNDSTLRPSVPLLDHGRIISRWATDGQSFTRVDEQTIEPILHSGTSTMSVTDSAMTLYSDLYNRALQQPLPQAPSAEDRLGMLGLYAGGSMVSIVQQIGSGFVSWENQQGQHAVVLRQGSAGGRPAEVIEVSPLYEGRDSSGKTTNSGKATIWLDTQYPIVLKLKMSGLGRDNPQHWLYRVTSLTVGQPPDPGFLQYQSPVPPIPAPSSTSSGGSSERLPGSTLSGPKGFITVTAPAGYSLRSKGESADPLWGKTSGIDGAFEGRGYIAVQEQVRVGGLPAQLTTSSSHQAGTCRVWTGTSSKAHWLALQRKEVSLLAVSNALSQKALIHFAATGIGVCSRRS